MRLPKYAKKNKPSKYVPKYDIMPTWEEMYEHWMQPYKNVIPHTYKDCQCQPM